MKNRGVIYIATTKVHYLESALISALALRKNDPKIPITIVSDQAILKLFPLDDYQISYQLLEFDPTEKNQLFFSRSLKTRLNILTPYEETLFLDADILPLQSISHLWDYLSETDIAIVRDKNPIISKCDHINPKEKDYTIKQLGGDSKHFNSGMILWRSTPTVHNLFSQWHQEWQIFQKQDQLAFSRAIYSQQISILELPGEYNVSFSDSVYFLRKNIVFYLLHWLNNIVSSLFSQSILTDPISILKMPIEYKFSVIDSVYFLKKNKIIYLLHYWDEIASGEHLRDLAYKCYPDVVSRVDQFVATFQEKSKEVLHTNSKNISLKTRLSLIFYKLFLVVKRGFHPLRDKAKSVGRKLG